MNKTHGATRRRAIAFVVLALATAVSWLAVAQPKRPATKPGVGVHANKPQSANDAGRAAPLAVETPAEAPRAAEDAGKAGAVVDQRTLDGGTRVFRFGEVEVEGRLKSPQIVYFLRRVRAEFGASDLGHRSFMSELRETKDEPSF